jgi:serine protease Do
MERIEYVRNNTLQYYARRCVYILIAMTVFACPNLLLDSVFLEKKDHPRIASFLKLSGSAAEAATADVPVVPESFSDLAEIVSPAVVNIRAVKIVKNRGGKSPSFGKDPFREDNPMKDFFDRFFGPEQQPDLKQRSLGSGFIIDTSGYVVTNNHVIENADKITVFLKNEKEYDAKIIGRDANTDIALIKIISEDKFPVVHLGDSDALKVGQWVVAIGNPFGLGHTVTAGIVSAKGRVIGSGPYDDYIQTDASINPGNSGGPLLNMHAEVVGINTVIIAGGQGIGFAIPVNMAKEVVSQLRDSGAVTRGWLGVSIQDLPKDLAEYFGIDDRQGVLIADVIPGDPADEAGIRPRDIVLEIDGEKIKNSRELLKKVANLQVGQITAIKVLRDGKPKVFDVKVARRDDAKIVARKEPEIQKSEPTRFNLTDTEGVVVVDLDAKGKGAEAGIRTGDIIKGINRNEIRNLKDYNGVIGNLKEGDAIAVLIKRQNIGFLVKKLEK